MFRQRYSSKYNSARSSHNGITYHSKKEAGFAAELDLRKKAGDIKGWQRQVRISLDVLGKHVCNYYIDFVITHNDESLEYVEVKGFETEVWRLKWRLFEIIFNGLPNTRLTVIK